MGPRPTLPTLPSHRPSPPPQTEGASEGPYARQRQSAFYEGHPPVSPDFCRILSRCVRGPGSRSCVAARRVCAPWRWRCLSRRSSRPLPTPGLHPTSHLRCCAASVHRAGVVTAIWHLSARLVSATLISHICFVLV